MARSRTSKAWMHEHVTDPFVQRAKKEGWRSRAVFKLAEINEKDQLINNGDCIVDLGAAPGGWSQYAVRHAGEQATIVALDILPMVGIGGVTFIQCDFTTDEGLAALTEALDGRRANLVLSDMAPNLSGMAVVDQARVMMLAELALDFCRSHLRNDGRFLVKVFQGRDYDSFVRDMRETFTRVAVRKPAASRSRSAEVYLLGEGLKH